MFLSIVSAATYKMLRNILSPAKPGEEYSELVEKLSKHYCPVPSEIVERFKFHSRSRNPGELIATFVAELRSLAKFCNFGDTLETMIRNRLVCGINDIAIQKCLLTEPNLTYPKAIEIAQATETAAQSLHELRSKPEAGRASPKSVIHCTTASSPSSTESSSSIVCFCCGRVGHMVARCRVGRSVVCHNWNKPGHLQRACKNMSKPKRSGKKKLKPVRVRQWGKQ